MPDFNGNGIDDAEEVNTFLVSKGLNALAFAWRAAVKAVEGVKTLFVGSTFAIIGLVDEMGGVDLLGSIKGQLSDASDPRLGRWLVGITIVFLVLRAVTNSKIGGAAKVDAGA